MADQPVLARWILDTRALWPGKSIQDSASDYLELLPGDERAGILRKYHAADARMSLASALLKRAYIVKSTGIKWSEVRLGRRIDDKFGKPCWIPPRAWSGKRPRYIDFNVSHQNGLVVLVGIFVPRTHAAKGEQTDKDEGDVEISVDMVSPSERSAHDLSEISTSDLSQFLSIYDTVLSDAELFNLSYTLPASGSITLLSGRKIINGLLSSSYPRADRAITAGDTYKILLKSSPKSSVESTETVDISSDLIVEEKLRVFYTTFCLKEAYFKLRGEGLTAEWIKDLEFSGVRAPEQGGVARCSLVGTWGETILCDSRPGASQAGEGFDITLNEIPITNVLTELQAYEENFIICTMLRINDGPPLAVRYFPEWERVDVERDVLSIATKWISSP